MEHTIRWGGPVEDVYVRTSGQASLEGLNRFIQDVLGDERWRPGMRVIIDHRELDWTAMTTAALRARVDSVAAESERIGKVRVATVVARTLDYGLQRMMQAYWGERFDPVVTEGIFYTVEEARAWLGQPPRS
jgi:hypothetical protein